MQEFISKLEYKVKPVQYGEEEDANQSMIRYWQTKRNSLLAEVNEVENMLGIVPSTAKIRKWWKDHGCPPIP